MHVSAFDFQCGGPWFCVICDNWLKENSSSSSVVPTSGSFLPSRTLLCICSKCPFLWFLALLTHSWTMSFSTMTTDTSTTFLSILISWVVKIWRSTTPVHLPPAWNVALTTEPSSPPISGLCCFVWYSASALLSHLKFNLLMLPSYL